MPNQEDEGRVPYSGDKSLLPFLLGAAPLGIMGYSALKTMSQATPLQQVVGSTYAQWAAGMRSWAPDLGTIDTALHAPILEAFKRRVGKETGLGALTSLEEAVRASSGFPALQSILKQSIGEFSRVKPSQLGGSILSGMETIGMKATPLTKTGSFAVTHATRLSEELARGELGISKAQRANLRMHLNDLAELTKDIMGTVPGEGTIPTFRMRMAGDKALSEMLVTVHRTTGPSVEMRIPLPSATGELKAAGGTRFYARKVLGDPERFLATGVAEEMDIAEYSIRRLRGLVAERQGAISQREVNELQKEIRKQMIFMGDKRGALATAGAGRTYAEQMVVPGTGISGNRISGTQRDLIMERLGEMGRGVGMTPDALAKGVVLTQAGAKRLPNAAVTPQHWTQALTKGELVGGGRMDLFQVAPKSVEMAAKQLGMETIMPRQDVIMMANDMKDSMQAVTMRSIRIDPGMEASHRFNKIQQMLADNATTKRMLAGGNTVEEAIVAYQQAASREDVKKLNKLRLVGEGEFLGFTKSGPAFAKTYGTPTFIRDFTTVGDTTHVVLEGRYTPQKLFSRGGIKHTVEYANASAVKRLGVRAKALELLRMQGVDVTRLDPTDKTDALLLARAEKKAMALYGESAGIAVEGAGWSAWEKISGGSMKNMSRFNQLVEEKWKADFGRLPRGYWQTEDLMERRRIMARTLQKRGIKFAEYFHPSVMARRTEILQPGPAGEMLGIGRPGTFTDDAFRIFRAFGWTNITEDMAKRVERDIPLQNLIEGAKRAVVGEGGAVPLEEIMRRPGGLEALLEDAGVRARFIAEEGGMVQLPQEYMVGGRKVSRIAIPEMGTGFTGYFTTDEGREIQRELDKQLRTTLQASTVDIGAQGMAGEELAATKQMNQYYAIIDRIARRTRDIEGGVVAGSRTFAIGREIAPDMLKDAFGRVIPQAQIHPATFEKWVAENLRAGMIDRATVKEYRRLFKMGRLPIKAIKHPARGPLSANVFYLGATPKSQFGWQAERNFMYLSESLLKPFVGDLDFDPLPADLFTSKGALAEATAALEGKNATGQLLKQEETVGYWLEQHARIRKDVLGRDIKGGGRGLISPWEKGKRSLRFMKERLFRDAASKTEVGIFTSRLGWPMGASMAEGGLDLGEWFKASFWAEIMEEKTTLKARHDMSMVAGTAEELAAAFQAGNKQLLKDRTRQILNLKSGEEAYFDDVLDKLVDTWRDMEPTRRELYEARFASKARASAKNFMTMASAEVLEGVSRVGKKMTSTTADVAARVFGRLGNAMRGNKKAMLVGMAATIGAGMLFSRPRDLTPEKVESGRIAGGPEMRNIPPTMAKMQKGLYYKKGSIPGYRINMTLTKGADHQALASELSKIAGRAPVNIHINDDRRKISRFDVERAMREDRVLGSYNQSSSFYNSSRY